MISTNEPYLIKHNITGIEKQGVTNLYDFFIEIY